ncbi:hypothetical protein ACJVDH_18540 [Pedobacter sp. AW1-32]|uniref:hypothetical protein n=1 Tax=Pedobacter sp. AW1-32 TaxID=3383026 RepID=UPI003FEF34AC
MPRTSWNVEPGKITIYPKRALRITALIFFVLFAAISVVIYTGSLAAGSSTAFLFYGLTVLVPFILYCIGESSITFNASTRTVSRNIFFLPLGSLPFDEIATIERYQVIGSGFNYMLFKRSNRHGKGWIVSGGYSKDTNKNLLEFENEVLPKIDELVFANAPLKQKQIIYDFEFFTSVGDVYAVKGNKIGSLILGIILVGVTIAILTSSTFMEYDPAFKRILVTYFPLVLGLIFINAYFSSIVFDKNRREIIHSTLAGRIKRTYSFDDLIHFQVLRKSTNFVYTGTEVNAQIDLRKKNRIHPLPLRSFRSTKKIERFLDEANTILGRI